MEHLDLAAVMNGGSIAINLFLALAVTRMKLELAEIKIWILENFERVSKD